MPTRNRLVAVLISGVVAAASLAMAPPTSANGCDPSQFPSGNGSSGSPFTIADSGDLAYVGSYAGCFGYYFLQTADIALTAPWTPIGTSAQPFAGTYDGGGFELTGLSAGTSSSTYVGLFGSLNGATVRNLTVSGTVAADSVAGGITGFATTSTLRNVHTAVSISASLNAGGLIGNSGTAVVIEDSSASGNISGASGNFGGLVGAAIPSSGTTALTIRRSWASGDLTGGWRFIGGLLGGMDSTGRSVIIDKSFATGNVVGDNPGYVGGLVGFVNDAQITDSYALGSVNAGAFVSGGLVGEVLNGTFTRLYGVNAMLSTANRGGVVGEVQGTPTFTGVTWDTTVGFADPVSTSSTLTGTTGNTTAALTTLATFSGLGWSISPVWTPSTTWVICPEANNGYPHLAAFYTAEDSPCPPAPGTPPAPTASAGDGAATVTAYRGSEGTPTSLVIIASPGSGTCTINAASGSCTVTGLTNGASYTFTATATNAAGTSSASAPSAAVTPRASGGSPTPEPTPTPTPSSPVNAVPAVPAPTVAPTPTFEIQLRPLAPGVSAVTGEITTVTVPVRSNVPAGTDPRSAPRVSASLGQVVRVSIDGLAPSSRVTTALQIEARWVRLGTSRTGVKGRTTLAAFETSVPGNYLMRIKGPDTGTCYVWVDVR